VLGFDALFAAALFRFGASALEKLQFLPHAHRGEKLTPPQWSIYPYGTRSIPEVGQLSIRVVRLGTPRASDEGLRLGTVRRPPRGVKKADFARRDWYDVWVPDLAPSEQLRSWALHDEWTDARWKRYTREYLREMKQPSTQRLIGLLAAMSRQTNFSVGCYCEDESRCHRSLLRELLVEAGASIESGAT
jgi:uncharacterized protein YeaO (DUF488 family)